MIVAGTVLLLPGYVHPFRRSLAIAASRWGAVSLRGVAVAGFGD